MFQAVFGSIVGSLAGKNGCDYTDPSIIEIYKDRMYILERLENYEINVETAIERDVHSMTC